MRLFPFWDGAELLHVTIFRIMPAAPGIMQRLSVSLVCRLPAACLDAGGKGQKSLVEFILSAKEACVKGACMNDLAAAAIHAAKMISHNSTSINKLSKQSSSMNGGACIQSVKNCRGSLLHPSINTIHVHCNLPYRNRISHKEVLRCCNAHH